MWHRVTTAKPCTVCRKGDWCTVSEDGAACCMRVQSDKPMANGGWLHGAPERPLAAPLARREPQGYEEPDFDAALWWQAARHVARPHKLIPWAVKLGLPVGTIDWLGATSSADMLAFPMHDGLGRICGIRTRTEDGQKRAITGSRAGVFLPTVRLPDNETLICEGPTDAAAALALGFEPIGRPSCTGQERHVVDTLKRWGCDKTTICADADGPGIAGANRLADALRAARIAVRMVAPARGHKDLRDWFRAGATRDQVEAAWSQQGWRA